MKRIVLVLLVLMSSFGVVRPVTAAPAEEYEQFERDYWFGTAEVENGSVMGSFFTTFGIDHEELDYPLPFQSFLTADLYDCKGRKARSIYGDLRSVKQQGRPWMTAGSVSLNLPPRGGPYAAWVVTVRSKGHRAETFKITDGGQGFTLDCEGRYRRHKDTFWAPEFDAPRPLNARFNQSEREVLADVARSFGRPAGKARVGGEINVVGARDAQGKVSCGLNMTITWPQRPQLGPDGRGTECGPYGLRLDATSYFKKYRADGSYRIIKAPTRGKHVLVGTTFYVRGVTYTREFDFGIVK